MSEAEGGRSEAVGARVRLECGHWVALPWGLAPEATAADLIHHRDRCDLLGASGPAGGLVAPPLAWLPSPGPRR